MKRCNCNYWEEGLKAVNSCIAISNIHGFFYDGKTFEFCPWCGNKLDDDTNPNRPSEQLRNPKLRPMRQN